jgi:hypothetical protein
VYIIGGVKTVGQTAGTSIAGKWHLIMSSEDEVNVPRHRVDFVFRADLRAGLGSALTGAIINRVTGEDIPLANVMFDDKVLTLQMADPNGQPVPAILRMTANGDKFEGRYVSDKSEPLGPMLKLVRFRQ